MTPEELRRRSAAVSWLKDCSLELWRRKRLEVEEIKEEALKAMDPAATPPDLIFEELYSAVRVLCEYGYPAEDIEWFSELAIYDFQEWEYEHYGVRAGR